MITLTLPCAPSRHKRTAKAEFLAALARCPQVKMIQRRRYRVVITFFGAWDQKNGEPKKRDADSPIIPLLDAIAQAAGIDDKYLNRKGSWEAINSDREVTVVKLTPL